MFNLLNYRKHFETLSKRHFYILFNAWFDYLENKNVVIKNDKINLIFALMKKDYAISLQKQKESNLKSKAGKKGAAKRWKKITNKTKNNNAKILNDSAIEEKEIVIKSNIKDSVLRIFQD